jgi:hypothetical protein
MPYHHLYRALKFAAAGLSCILLTALAGCVVREETIDVQPDGSAAVTVQYTADSDQELADLATPAATDGWKVATSVREEKDGKKKSILTATRVVAAGQPLPIRDGPADNPDAALQLQFATSVQADKRSDGAYYLFHRSFEPRSWAQWNHIEDREANDQLGKMLKAKNNSLSAEEWAAVIRRQIDLQIGRKLDVVHAAFLKATPDAPVDQWLGVRNRVVAAGKSIDVAALVQLLQSPQTPERDKAIVQTAQDADARIDVAIGTALTAQGYNAQQLAAFENARRTINRSNQITGQIENETFVVRLHLPGQVIGSNATTQKEDGTLEWRISGKQLMDRQVELMAASKAALP